MERYIDIDKKVAIEDMQIDMFQDGFGWTFRQIDMLHMHIDRYGQTDRNKCISRQIWMDKQIYMDGYINRYRWISRQIWVDKQIDMDGYIDR